MRRGGMIMGVLVGVLALAAAGCGGDDDGAGAASATTAAPQSTTTTTTTGGGGGENEFQLVATDFKWDQTSLEMQAGSEVKVEVRNQGSAQHNFTFTEADANQDVPAGEDATVTFTAPAAGSYQFLCKYHPTAMKGTITVT
jgi:plastocyanin